MDTRIRREPGPRDWSPSGSGQLPFAPGNDDGWREPPRPKLRRADRATSRVPTYRGIGFLSLVLGLGSLVFAARPEVSSDWRDVLFAATGPLALTAGALGLARLERLRLVERLSTTAGAGLGSIGTVALVASLAGIWSGLPAPSEQNDSISADTSVAAQQLEHGSLGRALGTAVFLLGGQFAETGQLPAQLVTDGTLLTVAPGMNVTVPAGTSTNYIIAADGSYSLTLVGASGAVALYDSRLGYILYG